MIAIIGGGAAGMMAAISAAEMGKSVTLIEPNEKLGRKIYISGKGRCNVTNDCDVEDIFKNIPTNPRFLYSAIYSFTNADTKEFFENCGVSLKVERGGRVFPQSDRAGDIVDALLKKIRQLGVKIIRDRALEVIAGGGEVKGVRCEKRVIDAQSVLIATGGKSYPRTGSTGDGYALAKKCGHTVTPLKPSLVPIVTREDTAGMMGLSLKNVTLTAFEGGKKVYFEQGEMLFTHFGLSGPLVLSASSRIKNIDGAKIVIDLKSALDEKTLDSRILRDFSQNANRDFINSLDDLLPKKIIGEIVRRSGIDSRKKVNSITRSERERLVHVIKNLEFTAKDFRDISEAIVTSGGVKTAEINPSTMESKIVKGLYFAGEVIDVDAYTGGFNLQIAFSTGHLAGINML